MSVALTVVGCVEMRFCILLLMLFITVQSEKKKDIGSKHEMLTDPCSCALLNFWDIKPREDATTCCEALKELCYESKSTLHCGHVYRFCLKRRAGYSAFVLDEFVRRELKHMGCDAFNPKATHEAEKCGGGFCRIGYTCETVNARKCYADGGLVCGDGFCNSGAECAEMSSQTCKRVEKNKLKKLKERFEDAECKKNICEACKTVTEYKCAFKSGLMEPCTDKGCARSRRCVTVPEEVCVIRPDAVGYLNGEEKHAPEKVKKKFRRYTAFLLPAVGALVAAISVIAFISWATVRVRRARKEVGFDDSDNETPRGEKEEKDVPLSPSAAKRPTFSQNAANLAHSVADILSPRLRVPTDHSGHDDSTPPRRRFASRNYSTLDGTDSMSDTER